MAQVAASKIRGLHMQGIATDINVFLGPFLLYSQLVFKTYFTILFKRAAKAIFLGFEWAASLHIVYCSILFSHTLDFGIGP